MKKITMYLLNSNKQQGQALLFVVLAMTVALTMGISISSRTLTGLKRSSATDTSARVLSAAEGGIEWFLVQPVEVLEKLSDADNTNSGADCPVGTTYVESHPTGCVISYNPQSSDQISTRAIVSITKFVNNFTDGVNDHYWFNLDQGNVKQIFTKEYSTGAYYTGVLQVCWKSNDEDQATSLYYTAFDNTGILKKQLVSPNPAVAIGISNIEGDIVADGGRPGTEYTSCFDINVGDISANVEGIRLKSLYATSKVGVFSPVGFPVQGYKILSLGEIDNVAEKVKTVRQVDVFKSLPYMPATFDYAVYSNDPIN